MVWWVVECVVGGPGCQETPGAVVSMESEKDPSDVCILLELRL